MFEATFDADGRTGNGRENSRSVGRHSQIEELARPRNAIVVLALAYFLARYRIAFTLDSPVFGWRPADMASIALSYLRNGFHFFYPQVFWGGNGPGYVEMEFPLTPFLTAILLKLFGSHEYLNLVIPQLCGFGLVWVIYRFGCRLLGEAEGLVAGTLAAVAPMLNMLTASGLWADPPMVLFSTIGLYFMLRWVDEDRTLALVLAACSLSLAILLKLTALHIGIPVLYLFVKKYGAAWWRCSVTWLTGLGILVPPALWYLHAYHLSVNYGNSIGILSLGYSKLGTPEVLTDPAFYIWTARRIFLYHLTPLDTLACLFGLFVAIRRKPGPILLVWLASVGFYLLVAGKGVLYGHFNYLLPILPVGCLLAAVGLTSLLALQQSGAWLRQRWYSAPIATLVTVVLLASSTAWAAHRFETRAFSFELARWSKEKTTGLLVKKLTRPGSLLIVVDDQMDAVTPDKSMTPPAVFYFSDRRGWYSSMAWLTEGSIERLHQDGADYLVVSGQSVADFKTRQPELFESLSERYERIWDSDDGIVFGLGKV